MAGTGDGISEQLEAIRTEALTAIAEAAGPEALEAARVRFLGRKSPLMNFLSRIGELDRERRATAGQMGNALRRELETALSERSRQLENDRLATIADRERIDVTFPGPSPEIGFPHPLVETERALVRILGEIGYQVEEGPEVETDWFNFEALNLPREHASRDAQDSFYFSDELLLRTHTSPVQIRGMLRIGQPPIRIICPGRTYRRDAMDATHLACFMQLEGLAVDTDLTVGDLKGTLTYMVRGLYGPDRQIRIRPHHFPFTEPSYEFDTSCGVCQGKGCRSCGGEGWLEIGGCGMVHPQVLRNGGIDPRRYRGFAWGFGLERMTMLRHDVDDLRRLYEDDLRFLEQLA